MLELLIKVRNRLKDILFVKTSPQNRYIRKFTNRSTNLLVLLGIVIGFYSVLLFFCKAAWYLYQHTQIGQQYNSLFSGYAQSISGLLNSNLFLLSLDITIISFVSCIAVCCVLQISHITRYFYLPRGFLGRIIFFGFPLTFIPALKIQDKYALQSIEMAYYLALIPTLCVFVYCFEYTIQLLPGIGEVIIESKTYIKKIYDKFNKYINND